MIEPIEVSVSEILQAIEKLKYLKDRSEDRPVKSKEYLIYESTIEKLCHKLKNVKLKQGT